ncbi:hypothetical protein [Allorhodopirellula solitaria]|uniref:hypothetical protein n=1 Tax=Allorhodopirellula solitaria TaxID=2527987 RepID=UPI0011B64F36|nr:hypothetical protein [Allorhodopirellula solitaria]
MTAAIDICCHIRNSNDAELNQKHSLEPVIIDYLGKMDALGRTLKAAGVREYRTTAEAIITIGFTLHDLPERFGLGSILSLWSKNFEIEWQYWVEIASACRTDIARYPGTYQLVTHDRILRVCPVGPKPTNPFQHEFTFFVDDFLEAMNDNRKRVYYLFAAVANDQLSPGQLRARKEHLMRDYTRRYGTPSHPYIFSPDVPAPLATASEHPKLRYVSLNW